MERQTRTEARKIVAMSWMSLAALYVVYAGATYSGLYQALAELELRILGSYEPTGIFLTLLFGLCLPSWFIAPQVWKKRQPGSVRDPANPKAAQRSSRRTMLALGAGALVVSAGAAGLALSQVGRSSTNEELDLSRSSVDPPRAGKLILSGRLQPHYAVTVEETINGSVTRTIYTPVTSSGWNSGEPIQYILRQRLGDNDQGEEAAQQSSRVDLVRFGPVAVFRHALPGMVRTDFEHRGLRVALSQIVLDQNLSSANETLWIVSASSFLFAFSTMVLWAIVVRTQRLNTAAELAELTARSSQTQTQRRAGLPEH